MELERNCPECGEAMKFGYIGGILPSAFWSELPQKRSDVKACFLPRKLVISWACPQCGYIQMRLMPKKESDGIVKLRRKVSLKIMIVSLRFVIVSVIAAVIFSYLVSWVTPDLSASNGSTLVGLTVWFCAVLVGFCDFYISQKNKSINNDKNCEL